MPDTDSYHSWLQVFSYTVTWRLLVFAWRARQWIYKVWATGHTGSLGTEGSDWSGWEGWIIPEFSQSSLQVCKLAGELLLCIHSHTIPRALHPLNCVQCLVLFQPFEDSECHTGKVMHPFALNDTASISFKYLAFILRGELCVVKHSAVLGIWHFFPMYTLLFF